MDDKNVPEEEAYRVIIYTANNHLGRNLAWDFLQSNFDAVKNRLDIFLALCLMKEHI